MVMLSRAMSNAHDTASVAASVRGSAPASGCQENASLGPPASRLI